MNDATAAATGEVVNVRRVFHLAPERMFRAWTDPAEFAKWWGHRDWTVVRCELDVQREGAWLTEFRLPGGGGHAIGGSYIEVAPPDRLVFTWEVPGASGEAAPSIVSVEFRPHADGTEPVLCHRRLRAGMAVKVNGGWAAALDSLGDYVAELAR